MTYEFMMPESVFIGENALEASAVKLSKFGNKALIVTGKHVVKSEMMANLLDVLKSASIGAVVFDGILSEPTDNMVDEGVKIFKENGCEFCIGIGGGSPLDAAKAIAAMTVLPNSISDYMGISVDDKVPPIVAIPTTAGTGSEATKFSIITDTVNNVKMLLKGSAFMPQMAIVDSSFTISCPQYVTAATGLDALTHAVEAYTSKAAIDFTDIFAVSAIKRIFKYLACAYKEPSDIEAREGLAKAAFEAGICINNASVTLVHGISRPLGANYHVPHGMANAMLLPLCLDFALDGALDKFGMLGRAVGVADVSDSDDIAASAFVKAVAEICAICEVPYITDYDIDEKQYAQNIEKMAEDALASGSPANTQKQVTKQDIIKIYQSLWKNKKS